MAHLTSLRKDPMQSSMTSTDTYRKHVVPHLKPFIPYVEKDFDELKEGYPEPRALEDWIHADVIKTWVRVCETTHQYTCSPSSGGLESFRHKPALLIDVDKECLVVGHERYVALSYVWGDSDSAYTTKHNLDTMLQPHGLTSGGVALPATVRDAMDLVRHLGERYLWVDRFCIAQDDDTLKHTELNLMNLIYRGSLFTIVAAENGSADEGLYGQRKVDFHKSRQKPLWKSARTKKHHRYYMVLQADNLLDTCWYSRGWTFQEYLFAPRRVVFHNGTVNWECGCASWHEGQVIPEDTTSARKSDFKILSGKFGLNRSAWPDMHRYARLVSLYNARELTFPEDVLDAFAGILGDLSNIFVGSFISGLPHFCFDAALLWQPWYPMKRRRPRIKHDSEVCLPSWSWVGWSGDINSESWRSAASYVEESPNPTDFDQASTWKTNSTVQWSYSGYDALDHTYMPIHRPQITVEDADADTERKDTAISGWTRIRISDQKTEYQHPCDINQFFEYPIPIMSDGFVVSRAINPRLLHGRTRRAFLDVSDTAESLVSATAVAAMADSAGRWAGVIRLNCYLTDTDIPAPGSSLELIEISAGSVDDYVDERVSFDEWQLLAKNGEVGVYKFYNVLWVEWVYGVAYRKALGRVIKRVWDTIEKEEIDLTLG